MIRQLVPVPEGTEGLQHSVAGCYLAIVGMFANILGWAFNPSFLPIMHEYLHLVAGELDGMVRVLMLWWPLPDTVRYPCQVKRSQPFATGPCAACRVYRWASTPSIVTD